MSNYIKYAKTYHFPWSQGVKNDDKIQHDLSRLENQEVIATEKMDGENATIYNDHYHARSLDSQEHWTRKKMYELQKRIGSDIPDGWRICGENLYAEHSIGYANLPDYFMVFSIWNDKNICLSWDETVEWCELLNLHTVPVLYRGTFSVDAIKNIQIDTKTQEGYVVRLAGAFIYEDFSKCNIKFVRAGHIQTQAKHWMYSNVKINRNRLIYESNNLNY